MQRTTFTNRTPLPNTLSEEAVLRILHDHAAMIEQNPLVIHYERISTPDDAPEDERDGAWYELTDRISYLPCGLLQGKLNYRGYLHDTPQGLRTHIYAPLGYISTIIGRCIAGRFLQAKLVRPVYFTCRRRVS